jgi:SAM-dependent methyltransferase
MKKTVREFEVSNEQGFGYIIKKVLSKIMRERINNLVYINQLFANKSGLEVGGPSRIFRNHGFVPLYKIVKELDGCNFSNITIWEGNIESGGKYNYYKNKKGIQYILEATDLRLIPNSKYDFIISSNCLEHVANPIKAIEEWIRVLKKGGFLFLVLPNKEYCFDHNRSVTKFSHLLKDYQNKITENDLTHLDEILELHDLKMDKPSGSLEQFKERSLKNSENRALHQHVFDIDVLKEIISYFKLEILLTYEGREYIILGKKNVS